MTVGALLWESETFAAWLKRRNLTLAQVRERDREYGFKPLTAKESGEAVKQSGIGETVEMTLHGADGKPLPHKRYCLISEEARQRAGKKYTQLVGTGAIVGVWQPKKPGKKTKGRAGRTVWFEEGEPKAWDVFEATKKKDTVVSVPGVRCFFKDGELHPTIKALNLGKGDTAKLCYDTDQWKPEIMVPLLQAAHALTALGCKVKIIDLPVVPNLKKTGADDVRAAYGDEALVNAPAHDFPESEWAQERIKQLAKLGEETLPEFSVEPISADWLDKRPPAPEYLIDGFLRRNILSLIYGLPSAGKGFFALKMAMDIAGGLDWCGHKTSQGKVVMLNFEEPAEVLRERVNAIYETQVSEWRIAGTMAHQSKAEIEDRTKRYREGLKQNLVVVSISGAQLHLIGMKDGAISQTIALGQLIQKLNDEGLIALFLDPMARLHGLEENSNPVATALVNACERLAAELRANVFLIHHTGKGDDESEHILSPRGASALPAGARFQALLRMVGKKDVVDFTNVTAAEVENGDVLKLVNNKNSWGRKHAPLWFKRSEADGTLKMFTPNIQGKAQQTDELLTHLKAWEKNNGGKPFAESKVIGKSAAANAKIYGRPFTKDQAKKFFDEAKSAGHIKLVPEATSRGGGLRYTVLGGGAS